MRSLRECCATLLTWSCLYLVSCQMPNRGLTLASAPTHEGDVLCICTSFKEHTFFYIKKRACSNLRTQNTATHSRKSSNIMSLHSWLVFILTHLTSFKHIVYIHPQPCTYTTHLARTPLTVLLCWSSAWCHICLHPSHNVLSTTFEVCSLSVLLDTSE